MLLDAYAVDLAALPQIVAHALPVDTFAALYIRYGSMPASCRLQVVKARGECMAAAAKQGQPHGMLSIIGLTDADLESVGSNVTAAVLAMSQSSVGVRTLLLVCLASCMTFLRTCPMQVINEARNNGSIAQDAVCQLANYLFPQVQLVDNSV
jgi:hypothetical protein